jgi:hypothetical protein
MKKGYLLLPLLMTFASACLCARVADGAPNAELSGSRDPMQAPPVLQPPSNATAGQVDDVTGNRPPQPYFIMAHGGRLSVIHNAHRLDVGDKLDNARIVRIENDAFWLRENGQLRKVDIYPDVLIKRVVPRPASTPHRARRASAAEKDAP